MRLRRGFSSPDFSHGGQSEFDHAVEIGARALYEFEPLVYQSGIAVPWHRVAEYVRAAARRKVAAALEAVREELDRD
jgi:hypothetical protein